MIALLPPLLLAWRPLLDPIDIDRHWVWLLVPLVVAVALVYKTLKLPTLKHLAIETARLSLYILFLMLLAAVLLWIFVEVA